MKNRRLRHAYRANSSSLHIKVGNILRSELPFKNWKVLQEYPCHLINPDFPNKKAKYDWVILDLKIVIEIMGEQHQSIQTFGASKEQALDKFQGIQSRDKAKANAARDAGFTYLEIWYNEIEGLTSDTIWRKYIAERN